MRVDLVFRYGFPSTCYFPVPVLVMRFFRARYKGKQNIQNLDASRPRNSAAELRGVFSTFSTKFNVEFSWSFLLATSSLSFMFDKPGISRDARMWVYIGRNTP